MTNNFTDRATDLRDTEAINADRLSEYLKSHWEGFESLSAIRQFPRGFSNLTYLLHTNLGEFVLRRPPLGANIKTAHDMHREFRVLQLLRPTLGKVPEPILYVSDDSVIGSEFYIMERVRGTILRNKIPDGMEAGPDWMRRFSKACITELANLHALDVTRPDFAAFGKPEGYVERQITGWTARYHKAKTDEVPGLEAVEEWMAANMPRTSYPAFIHNDYKYDNVVIDPDKPEEIRAILDWEMATLGDALMDLGTSLGYWAEATDPKALQAFGLTARPGNYTREEVAAIYLEKRGLPETDLVFYFVYGSYKIAVICQQIYARYKMGFTKDERFGALIFLVHACMANAGKAIALKRISNLY